MQGELKMLSIRLDSTESTKIVSSGVNSSYRKSICTRLKKKYSALDRIDTNRFLSSVESSYQKSICTRLEKYSVPGLCRVGCRIDTNRFSCCRFVILEVDLSETLFWNTELLQQDSFTSCGIDVFCGRRHVSVRTWYTHMLQNHCQLFTGDVHVCFH